MSKNRHTTHRVITKKTIGPTFGEELAKAKLSGLPFSWDKSGLIEFDQSMPEDKKLAVLELAASHDPDKKVKRKS